MKALIIIKEEQCSWLREIIPNQHPGMMPICNKPLLEYLLDFSILCGCTHIRFVMDAPDDKMEEYFAGGSRWGVDISYAPARISDDLETTLKKNSRFCEEEQLLILDGFFFIRHSKQEEYRELCGAEGDGVELSCAGGQVLCREGEGESLQTVHALADSALALLPLGSISDFFMLSENILARDAANYVLPGYNNEEGVFIGRNVAISKTTTINKPVMLGNNVQLMDHTEIGPGAIIGSNVIVDSGTMVAESIILDNSYLGAELTIKEKILRNNMAISASSGTVVQFVDDHLLSGLQQTAVRTIPGLVMDWCLGCLFYVLGILPAFFLKIFLTAGGNWQQQATPFLTASGSTVTMPVITIKDDTLLGKLARILVADKIMQLPTVLKGKIALVGNKPIAATSEGKELREDFVNYLPGIFYFSEAEGIAPGDFQEEITERFFAANRSIAGDIKILLRTFLNRW